MYRQGPQAAAAYEDGLSTLLARKESSKTNITMLSHESPAALGHRHQTYLALSNELESNSTQFKRRYEGNRQDRMPPFRRPTSQPTAMSSPVSITGLIPQQQMWARSRSLTNPEGEVRCGGLSWLS